MTTGNHHDIAGTALAGGSGRSSALLGPIAFVATPLPVIGREGLRAASVVLRAGAQGASDGAFIVALHDAGGAELMTFGPYEEAEVIAAWRALGASSGLPLVMIGPDGTREEAFPQVGRLRFGGALPRRRKGSGGRRPRFLVRRKTGRLPLRPLVHRGEPEIIGGAA